MTDDMQEFGASKVGQRVEGEDLEYLEQQHADRKRVPVHWKLNTGTVLDGFVSDDWVDLHVWFEIAGYDIRDEQVGRHTTLLYFECHVTIEPVYDQRLEDLRAYALEFGFRVADLQMRKRLADSPERSQFDTFCTRRDGDYGRMVKMMHAFITFIIEHGYKVWRYKIENTLLDVRTRP